MLLGGFRTSALCALPQPTPVWTRAAAETTSPGAPRAASKIPQSLLTTAHAQLPIPTTALRPAQVLSYLSHVTDDNCHDDPVDGHSLTENDAVGERQSLSTVSQ